ncbi:MAG: class II fructose-bisphosphate aldolase [Nitrospiria bacterium]
MKYGTPADLEHAMRGTLGVDGATVTIVDRLGFLHDLLDDLAYAAVFNPDPAIKGRARWLIKSAALASGVIPASIQSLYDAMGRGETGGFTVPAVNIRGLSYDVARAAVRASKAAKTGAFIFEIAKSEIGYTEQRPGEYAAVMIAAAIREGHNGPLFIQGDHFQVNAKKYLQDPAKEIGGLRDLIAEAIAAGFYNIDIDSSTTVDLSKPSIMEQQRTNYEIAADLTAHVRRLQPAGVTISVGGEIGEVGGKNSTEEELRAYMDGYLTTLKGFGPNLTGISKISLQTGTSHGGVPLPDGTVAEVALDFDTLEKLSKVSREVYGLSGAVQHGASTLPAEVFDRFPAVRTAEIHLATEFQNMILEHRSFPKPLKEQIYAHLAATHDDERKPNESDQQFFYKTRKKAFGPFKEAIWTLNGVARESIGLALQQKFEFLFKKLNVAGTDEIVRRYVTPTPVPPSLESEIAACK